VTRPLEPAFYDRPVVDVAREMVGCHLVHEGVAGRIVETEAYHFTEAACHAYVGVTPRTEVIWGPPGIAYVYRSYGIHAMLNAVCEPEGTGAAVLIRALEPLDGLDTMRARRGVDDPRLLCAGPGRVGQALGITRALDGAALDAAPFALRPAPPGVPVCLGPRIGLSKAIEQPWRFGLSGSRYLSRPFPELARLSRRRSPG